MDRQRERELRRLILEGLAEERNPPDIARNLLVKRLREEGQTITELEEYEIIWLLVREGLVFLEPDFNNDKHLQNFRIHLTERGKRFIEESGQYQPDDPDGYIQLLEERCADLDPLVKDYLQEAVLSYRAQCYLAATVMLGCASEQVIVSLGDAFILVNENQINQRFTDSFRSQRTKFSAKLAGLRDQLLPRKHELPAQVQGKFEQALQTMAEFIRLTRNEAGHPTGVAMSEDQVRINLTTAGFYFELIEEMRAHFVGIVKSPSET
jgi:hypothetical protein